MVVERMWGMRRWGSGRWGGVGGGGDVDCGEHTLCGGGVGMT